MGAGSWGPLLYRGWYEDSETLNEIAFKSNTQMRSLYPQKTYDSKLIISILTVTMARFGRKSDCRFLLPSQHIICWSHIAVSDFGLERLYYLISGYLLVCPLHCTCNPEDWSNSIFWTPCPLGKNH